MRLSKKLEQEVLKVYNTGWDAYLRGDLKTYSACLSRDFKIIGTTEGENFNSKKAWLAFCKRTIHQVVGVAQMRNRTIQLDPVGDGVMVVENSAIYIRIDGKWQFYSWIRITALLQKEKTGWKYVHQHGSLPDTRANEDETIATKQIKKENLQLREAVKRRTIELEEKNRELEIEAAIERVRAVAMGMKKPEEMMDVCRVVSDQLQQFGVDHIRNVQIVILDEAFGRYLCYQYFTPYTKEIVEATEYRKSPVEHEMAKQMLASPEGYFTGYLDGKELNQFREHRKREKHFPDPLLDKTSSIHYYFYSIGPGGMGVTLYRPLDDEGLNIFKRFHKVFSLAYRRFRDIEQAEAQAREAKIEAALERVRSRTMAMHNSNDLLQVINILSEQLKQLGFNADAVSFITDGDEKGYNMWLSSPEDSFLSKVYVPRISDRTTQLYESAIAQGKNFYSYTLTKEEKDFYFKNFFENTVLKNYPEEEKQKVFDAPGMATTNVLLEKIVLSVSNFHAIPYSEQDNLVIRRFASVFQQSYTRFLDLQKAEAQAREAQIEAALEKVRGRSLAMHKAEELGEVVTLVVEKLRELNIPVDDGVAIVTFVEGSKDLIEWMENPGFPAATKFYQPYFDHPVLADFWDAKNGGFDFVAPRYTAEENKSFLEHIFKYGDFQHTPQEVKDYCLAADTYSYSVAFQKHSAIFINDYSGRSLSDQETEIVKRFSKVFEQAYIRFLDLQKAEAQAREAKIETALEKVRSRTMGMQSSEELPEVANLLFLEVQALGIPAWSCGYCILLEDRKSSTCIMSSEGTLQKPFLLPHYGEVSFEAWDNFIQGDETFFIQELGEKAIESHYGYMKSLPQLIPIFKEIEEAGLSLPTYQINHLCKFSYGFLLFITYEAVEESHEIFKRFTKVFDQTYTRFLDLKKAEAQATEATRQASLDRVRGEIASMRTTADLQRITPLIWRELITLGVPFFRCGVFIIDEQDQRIHAYLSTPEGKSLAALHLPFDSNDTNRNAVEHWREQKVYTDHWDRQQFQAWAKAMLEQHQIEGEQQYQAGETPPESLSLQFIPFKQGMLYVGSSEALEEDQINLIKSLADAFSVAYARYEDFKQLEDAKNRVEATLTELKATQSQLVQSEKMASLGELTAGIAHEIQNPLNFVNNFSEVSNELLDEMKEEIIKGNYNEVKAITDDVKQNLDKILHHGKRADAIVKSMLQHSRTSSGKKELTDINELCDEYLRLAYHGYRAKDKSFNAKFETQFDPGLPNISIVTQDIGRVILNLINNAFYAVNERLRQAQPDSRYEPCVVVSTNNVGGKIEIRVKDNGPGIPDHIREKIFQPFFTTKPTGQGTGLGLSLSYDIIKAQGGEMGVESKDGEGSEFIIQLRTD